MFRTVTAQFGNIGNLLHIGPQYQETVDQQELRSALERGDRAAVKRLIAGRPTLAMRPDSEGATPLHWLMAGSAQRSRTAAIGRNNGLVMLNCLLDAKADPNQPDQCGRTPLHLAVQADRDPAWVRALLARGANVHATDSLGRTALHLALEAGAGEASLIALLQAGADPLLADRSGHTPASLASGRQWHDVTLNALAGLHRPPAGGDGTGGRAIQAGPATARSPHSGHHALASHPAVAQSAQQTLRQALLALGEQSLQGTRLEPTALGGALRDMAARLRAFDPDAVATMDRRRDIGLALRILLAMCPDVDDASLQPCHECLRALRQAEPDMDRIHRNTVIPLYVEMSRLWARTGHWKEAYCYAFHAYRLDAAAGAAMQRDIEDTIDRLERGVERHDLTQWAPIAIVPMRAAWFDIGMRLASGAAALATLRECHGLLQRAARVRQWLQGDLDPAHVIPVAQLRRAVEHLLNATRTVSSRAAEFVETAALALAMARDMQRLDLALDGAMLCELVVRQREEECVGELRRFDCEPHRLLAQALRQPCDLPPPPQTGWRQFRQALCAMRDEARQACGTLGLPAPGDASLADWHTPLPIEHLQHALALHCRGLVRRIAESCEARMLCDPPCRYALMGLGSVGHGHALPFSDVEFVLVVEQPAEPGSMVDRWFSRFTSLIDMAFHSLGESSAGADHALAIPRGFELDSSVGAASEWRTWLGTPQQIGLRLRQRAERNHYDRLHTDQDLCFSLLSATLLHGDAELAELLWASTASVLDDADAADEAMRYSPRQDIALRQMHADLQRLRAQWQSAAVQDGPIELKGAYAGPLIHLLTALAQCYGFRDSSVPAMLRRLQDAGRFSLDFLKDWRWAVATVQTIRCRVQLAAAERVDTVGRDRLTADEAAALHAVYTRVLRPLANRLSDWLARPGFPSREGSGAAVIAALRALDGCEPALLPFGAESTQRQQTRPDSTALRGLVATLAVRVAGLPTLRHYYALTLQATPARKLDTCWSIWQQHLGTSAYGRAALSVLERIPAPCGWRGDWTRARAAFRTGLLQWAAPPASGDIMLQLPADRDGADRADMAPGMVSFPLSQAIAAQLLDADGSPRGPVPDAAGGFAAVRVTVPSHDGAQAYHVRFFPANAGAELSTHALECRLAGNGGMPFGLLACLLVGGRRYGMLITEAVEGPTLAQRLADGPGALSAIEAGSFARALLRVLLADPCDDGAEAYVLQDAGAGVLTLRRAGAERAFPCGPHWPPGEDARGASVLYCLDQMMAPLERDTLAALCRLRPDLLVEAWMKDVARVEALHRSLFSADEVITAFHSVERPMLLTTVVDPRASDRLLARLTTIHGLANLAARYGVALTGMDLLKAVHPDLAPHYLQAFARYPVAADDGAAAVAARVAWAAEPPRPARPALAAGGLSSAAIPVVEPMRHGSVSWIDISASIQTWGEPVDVDGYDVAEAAGAPSRPAGHHGAIGQRPARANRGRHGERRRFPDLESVTVALLQGEPDAHSRFAVLSPVQRTAIVGFCADAMAAGALRLTGEQGRRLLAALAGTPLAALDLRAFGPAVDDIMLSELLAGGGDSLSLLDVSGCDGLTPDSLALIEQYAPRLTHLAMRNLSLPELARVFRPGAVMPMAVPLPWAAEEWVLPALRYLDLRGSGSLQRIRFNTPALATLDLGGCSSLREVVMHANQLRELDLTDCAALDEPMVIRMAGQGIQLHRVRLTGCTGLHHLPWRERFPWLLDFSWNRWTAGQIAALDTLLQQASGPAGRDFPPRARALVREAIHSRKQAIAALRRFSERQEVPRELRDEAAQAAEQGITVEADSRIPDALDTLSAQSDDSGALMMTLMFTTLQTESRARQLRFALQTITRLMALPSPARIARWMEPE